METTSQSGNTGTVSFFLEIQKSVIRFNESFRSELEVFKFKWVASKNDSLILFLNVPF